MRVRVSARLHAIRGDGSRQSISARSSTVPGGDTPCLTAGDARRVNPWRKKPSHPPTPAVSNNIHTCYSPSTLAVRRLLRRIVVLSLVHGFSLAPLGHHPRLSMVCLRRRRGICGNNCLHRRRKRSCSTTVGTNYSSLLDIKRFFVFHSFVDFGQFCCSFFP